MKNEKIKISPKNLKFWFLNFIFAFLISNFNFIAIAIESGTPHRIISLAPNLTEIIFKLGLGDRIVGVTNYCDYPDEARKKQKVGGMYNPSLEKILSLKPDVVVMTTDGNIKEFEERLRRLKIKTFVFKVKRLYELPQGIRDLGIALGVKEKAEALAKEIEEAIKERYKKFNKVYKGNNKKKVLFIIWSEPLIVVGRETAIDDAINLLGCENVAKTHVFYPKYSIEEIIRQAPDVIFIGSGRLSMKVTSESLLKRISDVPAVKNGEVYYISDSIYRLGPRIIKGIDEMAQCLR
jgi:iron complex transport system substrate-binding protein